MVRGFFFVRGGGDQGLKEPIVVIKKCSKLPIILHHLQTILAKNLYLQCAKYYIIGLSVIIS